MTKNFTKIKVLIFVIIIVVLAGNVTLGLFLQNKKVSTVSQTSVVSNYFSYQGVKGKDALTLLKQKASVEQDSSGLVISINSRKATSDKREYWAFYVNDKMAEVGPADYETKEGDKVEWKIEKY